MAAAVKVAALVSLATRRVCTWFIIRAVVIMMQLHLCQAAVAVLSGQTGDCRKGCKLILGLFVAADQRMFRRHSARSRF